MKKIIIITGLSGTGKSTLCQKLGQELSLPVIHVSDIIRQYAKEKGYERLAPFFNEYGYQRAYDVTRPIIFDQIKETAEDGIVLDGIYDFQLYHDILEEYRHDDITVGVLTAPLKERIRRHSERKKLTLEEGEKSLEKRDEVKWSGGIQKIMDISDFTVDTTKSQEECLKETLSKLK